MKAYQMYLKDDDNVPQFKNLACREVETDLRTILLQGVHPAGLTTDSSGRDMSSLAERLVRELNDEMVMLPELRQLSYCTDMVVPRHLGYHNACPLVSLFQVIADDVYFAEDLHYVDLVRIAREQLKRKWSHQMARRLLMATGGGFNDIRRFLKRKSRSIKLSRYDDIDTYNLGEILTVDDFDNCEKTLITHGLPKTNFRSTKLLERITRRNGRGFLGLGKPVHDFEVMWFHDGNGHQGRFLDLIYSCKRRGEVIKFIPNVGGTSAKRELAKSIAQTWGRGTGRYCFTVRIEDVEKMVNEGRCDVRFPSLNYIRETLPIDARGEMAEKHVERYFVGQHITALFPNEKLKEILREHDVPVTGRKEELLRKVCDLLGALYKAGEKTYSRYFAGRRFLRVNSSAGRGSRQFDVEENSLVNNTLLAMYVLKHMRGNAILDASHENDTFGLENLAESLINNEVQVKGHFLRVE